MLCTALKIMCTDSLDSGKRLDSTNRQSSSLALGLIFLSVIHPVEHNCHKVEIILVFLIQIYEIMNNNMQSKCKICFLHLLEFDQIIGNEQI